MRQSPEALRIIRAHQQDWPVKVGAIASDLGLKVLASTMPSYVSGSLRRSSNGDGWTIKVNRHEHRNRQRFTVAHEIAHFVLHKDRIGDGVEDDTLYRSQKLSDEVEWEANRLAADILMPWHLIRRAAASGLETPEQLAKAFEVSEAAMRIRLGLPT